MSIKEVLVNYSKTSIMLFMPMIFFAGCGSHTIYKESTMVSKPYHAPELDSQTKQNYLNAVNKVRSQGRNCGHAGNFSAARALKWSNTLYKASFEHSQDMAKSNNFSHNGSYRTSDWTATVQHLGRGSSFRERIENNGYKKWKNIAENIEMGSSTINEALAHWLASDQHCANIMNPDFTDVGMASVKKEGTQLKYWTQKFAAHQ